MNTKILALTLISLLILLNASPVNSAGRGRLKITEVSPIAPLTLSEAAPEATLKFTVSGMIIPANILAMIMTSGGIPVEVTVVPNNPSFVPGVIVEPANGLITFDRPSREFGVFETKIKLTSQSSQRTIRNLVTQGAFSCEREDGVLQSQGNIGNIGQINILCMGTGLSGETMLELGGSTGNTSIATVTPDAMTADVNPDGSTPDILFTINVLMAGETDVAFDFIGSMTFEVLGTLWNFQQGNAGNNQPDNMQGGNTTDSGSDVQTISSAANGFTVVVEDGIRPKGAIMSFIRRCQFSPAVQDTAAFATCP